MKLSILIPSEEYRNYAGARIRYSRLRPNLLQLGVDLDFQEVSTFAPERAECDVLLISKCHDAPALVAAEAVSRRGRIVGVDLFDNYFSQISDSRLVRFRNWLTQLLPICDFALCSTQAMANIAASYRPDLPVHVVNDPGDGESGDLSEVLTQKLVRAVDERMIRLAWFGVGDNPYFEVGLSDLAAYGHLLEPLRYRDFDVELSVLTNSRALDAHGLELIAQLPVRSTVQEWTLARERAMLEEAFACFLPVNAQSFSTAKSLNRAVTALSAGCQVISAGYPLYAPLENLTYPGTEIFLSDLIRRQMRLSTGTISDLAQTMNRLASPTREATDLVRFLRRLEPSERLHDLPLALIHAHAINGSTQRLVQAVQGISVASPYCAVDKDFDVLFRGEGSQLIMLLSQGAVDRVRPEVRGRLRSMDRIGSRKLWKLCEPGETLTDFDLPAVGWERGSLPFQLATYHWAMNVMQDRMKEAFGSCRIIVSETSSLPFVVQEQMAS